MSKDMILVRNKFSEIPRYILSLFDINHSYIVVKNLLSLGKGNFWEDYLARGSMGLDAKIHDTIRWINRAQDGNKIDDGVSCYEFKSGWTEGFPEVTGYIIPSYWKAYEIFKEHEIYHRVIRMSRWLLSVQGEDGAIARGYYAKKEPPIIFDTGQALWGFMESYIHTDEEIYLDAAKRAGRWIMERQSNDGAWRESVYKDMVRVYDTYVARHLYKLGQLIEDERYKDGAIRNCLWALKKQNKVGWFEDCDNSQENNDYPLTHTISYTVDGLIDVALMSGNTDIWDGALRTANKLLHLVETKPRYYARWQSNWKEAVSYVCLTGLAQTGIIFCKLYRKTKDARYLNGALKAVDFLTAVSDLNGVNMDTRGGMAGSYPIWGLYMPFKLPSWASKYYLDLLMELRQAIQMEKVQHV